MSNHPQHPSWSVTLFVASLALLTVLAVGYVYAWSV